ncbi:MAG: CGNR zinc finger domain-containing protein [Candidatus Dormibacteraeota bacterium]|nr:CGNR zinc finger domain-containing protein [Candidatus Dormibacteraeota bacterium]
MRPLPNAWAGHACLDLVNSRWMDHLGSGIAHDRLPLLEWRRAFFSHWGLLATGVADAVETVEELRELRGVLRGLLEAFSRRQPLPGSEVDALNAVLAGSPRAWRLETAGGRPQLAEVALRPGWRWALAEVAASGARLLAGGDPDRLRVCANPDCSWMFYDDSRAGSRRWCEAGICGSLIKVRLHRARRREHA